ncbi:MAG: trypsin-like peptidase domain-containing protein [Microbacterium sp.]
MDTSRNDENSSAPTTDSTQPTSAATGWPTNIPPRPDLPTSPPTTQQTNQTQPTTPLSAGWTVAEPTAQKSAKQKSGAGRVTALVLASALIGGGLGFGGAWAGGAFKDDSSGTAISSSSTGGATVVNNTDSVTEATAVASTALPSVVTIEVSGGESAGSGSGVILSDDGYVATNTHVLTLGGEISDPTIKVTASDGTIYDATVVGMDPTYDLAVIKLDGASGLTPIDFADSSKLNVGGTAIAIGAPLGLDNTVTTGVISSLERSIEIQSSEAPEGDTTDDSQNGDGSDDGDEGTTPWYFDIPGQGDDEEQQQTQTQTQSIAISVIQTDAAINPGNSGGALLDSEGKLIGINVAIATADESSSESGSIGVGFAIPSNIVDRITQEIIDNGEATHGLLGAGVKDASTIEGATHTGAYIAEVTSGGAAEKAGLKEGDVVTSFNGENVSDAADLTARVRAAAADSDATLTYIRDGKEATVDLTLGTLDS